MVVNRLKGMTTEEFYEKEAERLDAERERIDEFEEYIRWCKPEETFKIWSQYVWDMEDTNILYVGRTGEPGCTPMPGYKTEEYDPEKPYVWVSREYREIGSVDDFREDILGHRDEVMEWMEQEGGLEAVLHGE